MVHVNQIILKKVRDTKKLGFEHHYKFQAANVDKRKSDSHVSPAQHSLITSKADQILKKSKSFGDMVGAKNISSAKLKSYPVKV